MANLVLTLDCNRSCEYCFAKKTGDTDTYQFSLKRYEQSLDYLQTSGINEARLLGGEPTMHPDFITMVDMALDRGMHVTIFSGGVLSRRTLDALEKRQDRSFSFLVNVVYPFEGTLAESQTRLFSRLGSHCLLGINIDHPGIELDFLIGLCEKYDLIQRVRLGLAHPNIMDNNRFLHPKHYLGVGRRVQQFERRASEARIGLEFDCGWIPCMFSGELSSSLQLHIETIGQRCSPILDLLPDGVAIHCFPMRQHSMARTTLDRPAKEVRKRLQQRLSSWRAGTIYKRCDYCQWRSSGKCMGGCLAMSMQRQSGANYSDINIHSG